jgi:hypothetical protein
MTLEDYRRLGGHMDYVRTVQDTLRQGAWHHDGAPGALKWITPSDASPWPLGHTPMLG